MSWKPGGGYDGKFRGLPNGTFHPGETKHVSVESITEGPVRLRVIIATRDSHRFVWDYYPTYVRVTRLGGAYVSWWYEGTPGGFCDAGDSFVTSSGAEITFPITDNYYETLTDHWVVYKDGPTKMSLFLESHPGEVRSKFEKTSADVSTMHVARFNLPESPNPMSFTVGLVESKDNDLLKEHVESIFTDPVVTVGKPEKQGSTVLHASTFTGQASGIAVKSFGTALWISGLSKRNGSSAVIAMYAADGSRVFHRAVDVTGTGQHIHCETGSMTAPGHYLVRVGMGEQVTVSSVVVTR